MGIDSKPYEKSLIEEFSDKAFIFQELIESFWLLPKDKMNADYFNCFYIRNGLSHEDVTCNKAFDLFNYLSLFNDSGKFGLFKFRQPEWGGPSIRLDKSDVPKSDIHLLSGIEVIYRGMSIDEFQSRIFGQSWTTHLPTARRFAISTYDEKPAGIVAATKLNPHDVIYYSESDHEREVIVSHKSIHSADIVEA